MAITFPITAVTNTFTATRSPSFTLGTAPATDDVLVFFETSADTTVLADPSGWVNVLGANVDVESDSNQGAMLYHIVTSGEAGGGQVTWTLTNLFGTTESGRYVVAVLRGVDVTDVLAGTATSAFDSANAATPWVAPTMTPDATSMVLRGYGGNGVQSVTTAPTGHTLLGGNSSQACWFYSWDTAGANGVATGTATLTPSGGDEYIAITAAFKEAASGVTQIAQVAILTLTPVAIVPTGGTVTKTAQIASLTITSLAVVPTGGPATIAAQVATLTIIAVAIVPDTDFTFTPADIPDMRAWWDAENYSGSGTTWPDGSGNALDATLVNSPTWSTGANGAKQFEFRNASSHYAERANNALLQFGATDSFTVIAIVHQYTALASNRAVVAKRSNAANAAGYNLSTTGATLMRSRVSDASINCQADSGSLATGTQYLHGIVRDVPNDQVHSYLDNTKVSVTDTTTAAVTTTNVLRIGNLSNTTTLTPDMDLRAVLIYGGVLTATDIANLLTYFAGPPPSGGAVTQTAQVATLTLTSLPVTPTAGEITQPAQVATLTVTPVPIAPTAGAITRTAQVASITLTGVVNVPTAGPATKAAQVASIALTGSQGILTTGAATQVAQVALLSLVSVAVVPTGGAITQVSQVASLTLTAIPNVPTISGGSTQTQTAQVATLALTSIAGVLTTGAATQVAQVVVVNLTALPVIPTGGPITKTSQVATLALTALPVVPTGGPATKVAQVASLTLTSIAVVPTGGVVTLTAQIAVITLMAIPGTTSAAGGPGTQVAQVASITLVGVMNVPTAGAATMVAQVASMTITAVPGVLSLFVTQTAQVVVITLTGMPVIPTAGPATRLAQVANLILTALAGLVDTGVIGGHGTGTITPIGSGSASIEQLNDGEADLVLVGAATNTLTTGSATATTIGVGSGITEVIET